MSALSETVVDPSTSAVTRLTVRPLASVSRRSTWALVISSTLGCSSAGSTQITWASDLAFEQAGEPVDPVTADAPAGVGRATPLVLGEVDADRQVERVQALLLQVVAQLLDPWLVLHRRAAAYWALAAPSVGSSPWWPCTRYRCSAWV